MNDVSKEDLLYSDEVIGFLKEAAGFCELLENAAGYKRKDWFERLRRNLPRLYDTALALPEVESIFEESNEKFVTEQQYEMIRNLAARKTGSFDDYPEVFNPDEPIEELQITVSLSENLADIYQDIKDFITLYHLGNNEVMNDALWEIKMNFEQLWGQKLLNALRVVHRLITWGDISEEEEIENRKENPRNTKDWFISRRQQEYGDDPEPGPDTPRD